MISDSITSLISFTVFFISYRIYSHTEGASLAYKKWAIGTFLSFLAVFMYLLIGLIGSDNFSSEFIAIKNIIGNVLISLGYFYFPIGVMYLSKDIGIGTVNEVTIKKIQKIFFGFIFLFCLSLAFTIPFKDIRNESRIFFNTLYSIIWIFTISRYAHVYPTLKQITNNRCWTLLYVGIIGAFLNDFLTVIDCLTGTSLFYIILASQLMMAVGIIFAFFMLAKMLNIL